MEDGTYKIRLKAPPVDGKANAELLNWLSKQFSVSRTGIAILSGASSRTKMVKINDSAGFPDWYAG